MNQATTTGELPDYAPIPKSALGPALNDQGYYVGRVERNLSRVTDRTCQSAFLTARDGVALFGAPRPSATTCGAPSTRSPRILRSFTTSTAFMVLESIRLDLGPQHTAPP